MRRSRFAEAILILGRSVFGGRHVSVIGANLEEEESSAIVTTQATHHLPQLISLSINKFSAVRTSRLAVHVPVDAGTDRCYNSSSSFTTGCVPFDMQPRATATKRYYCLCLKGEWLSIHEILITTNPAAALDVQRTEQGLRKSWTFS